MGWKLKGKSNSENDCSLDIEIASSILNRLGDGGVTIEKCFHVKLIEDGLAIFSRIRVAFTIFAKYECNYVLIPFLL